MNLARYLGVSAIAMAVSATSLEAQPAVTGNIWSHGTTLNVFAGATTVSGSSAPIAGGAAGWEITPWMGIEGNAAWSERSSREDAFTAALAANFSLTGPRRAVPFVRAGVGLYRALFDASTDPLPEFYRRGLGNASSPLDDQQFTDPSFVFGGGVNVFTTRHLAIRPQFEAIVVRRESHSRLVTAVTVHLAYHIENHPVTPGRR
jgi:hypothetical protein